MMQARNSFAGMSANMHSSTGQLGTDTPDVAGVQLAEHVDVVLGSLPGFRQSAESDADRCANIFIYRCANAGYAVSPAYGQ